MTSIFSIVKRLLASNRLSFILTVLVALCCGAARNMKVNGGQNVTDNR